MKHAIQFPSSLFVSLAIAMLAVPALAQTNISSPSSGQQVNSPFYLTSDSSTCSGQSVVTVGFSLDDSPDTTMYQTQTLYNWVNAPLGWHTVHVKAWDGSGDVCVTDVSVNVTSGDAGSSATSVIPSNAVSVSAIQTLSNWTGVHDEGTPGSSSGTMSLVSSPSLTGTARLFANQFNYYGGERYSAQFDDDTSSQNFFYDTWLYIANDADGFNNLEFDLYQTMQNGETVIMGFQCDAWTYTWDYTVNGGSPDNPSDTWQHSNAPCNLHSWGANQWHHVQIYFSHDENGWVMYHSVWLDGNEQDLNIDAFSGFSLGWGPAILTNFQIDGNSAGTTWGNVYLDNLTVYRW